jgi:guanine deaminase
MDQAFIDKAVGLAVENVARGGKPFGAVIVVNGNIIATGINEAAQTGDLTAHAEIQAMRQAAQHGKANLLKGAVMYASGHPCPMCLAAMHLAGFSKIIYDTPLEAVEGTLLDVKEVYAQMQKPFAEQAIPLVQLKAATKEQPVQQWLQQQKNQNAK